MADFKRKRFGGKKRFEKRDDDRPYQRPAERGRGRSDFRQRDSGPREMHTVICAECGNECQVPFKPTSNKPVYCSDCFRKDNKRDSGRRNDDSSSSSAGIEEINKKLDRIMKALQID